MKTEQRNQIIKHGENLNKIFNTGLDPLVLCKKLHRIEVKANRLATDYCNGVINQDQWLIAESKIEKAVDKILHYAEKRIPVFVNGDPRGYALKIEDGYVRKHNIEIHRDMGGYGIIAPEIK